MEKDALRWTTVTVDDVRPLSELINHLAAVDDTDEIYSPEDLAEELAVEGFTPELDTLAVWAGDDLVAYCFVSVRSHLDSDGLARGGCEGGVHPQWRGKGIGQRIFDWQEHRVRELAGVRHPGVASYLRVDGQQEGAHRRRILQRRGYRLVRYFNELELPLTKVPETEADVRGGGTALRAPEQTDGEDVRLVHNLAFADHWGATSMDAGVWQSGLWGGRALRLAHSTIVLDADGAILSYVIVQQYEPREAYVCLVGTVPSARGRGLARAALLHTLRSLKSSGDFDKVDLGVDASSPTGATGLYEQLGFSLLRQTGMMRLDLG
ncbi:GNAT family N-acetyltransferase [Ornithinimicrobium sp. Arc0846-15]|nr:GNAT family N-acetyltransferase [Ornithinimicrobium laminariae]